MKATLMVETTITITLDLKESGVEFSLPQHRQGQRYTVVSVAWLVKSTDTHSHPITAKAIDSDNVEWTLTDLRWSDLPDAVQSEFIKLATPEGLARLASEARGREIQAVFSKTFPNT